MCQHELLDGKIKLWTDLSTVEQQALEQLTNIGKLPWVFKMAVMPDVHFGKGATVGSVISSATHISPAAVGVDIGCGMAAYKLNLTAKDLPDSLKEVREGIEQAVPVGFAWHDTAKALTDSANILHMSVFHDLRSPMAEDEKLFERAVKQIGTLGGGNHFIELCLDESDNVWVVLHSGSRNIGKTLAEYHINVARKMAHNADLPDPDTASFLVCTKEMEAYRHDLMWAQDYARLNRESMAALIFKKLLTFFPDLKIEDQIACHHNYVSEETLFDQDLIITRKGAISAYKDQRGIIPGSMGTRSYIVSGLGNTDALCSASHGAGRSMSRGAAKRAYTVEDLAKATEGVECRKDAGVLDEIPMAYKDIDVVMENQKDLVRIEHTLKQVLCVKG